MSVVPLLLLAPAAAATAPTFAVHVSASPATGTIPLSVTFTASVTQGVPTGVDWTFGDGATWNGTGPAALTVIHRYVAVGSFVAVATVVESTGVSSAFTTVNVESGPLTAAIAATPSTGSDPLAVTLRAIVTGGTGTYTDFAWSFGDGGVGAGPVVNYTFRGVGLFHASLTVRDSANQTAIAWTPVNVTAAPAGPSGPAVSGWAVPTTLATGGVVGAGLALRSLYYGRRRRAGALDPADDGETALAVPPGALSGPTGVGAGTLPSAAGAAATASAATAVPAGPVPAPAGEPSVPRITLAPPSAGGTVSAPAIGTPSAGAEEPRRWSRELVAYLGSLPILGPDDIPSLDWTQKGMSERLGTGQNQVSNVLRRLVAAGIVVEGLEHVQGQPRRLKVYRLTPRGEALARELRRRRAAARNRPSGRA